MVAGPRKRTFTVAFASGRRQKRSISAEARLMTSSSRASSLGVIPPGWMKFLAADSVTSAFALSGTGHTGNVLEPPRTTTAAT